MVVIASTQEMVATNAINQLASVVVKLSAIVKIYEYRRLHEGHHFILMAMDVHGTFKCDMDHLIRECVCLFQDR